MNAEDVPVQRGSPRHSSWVVLLAVLVVVVLGGWYATTRIKEARKTRQKVLPDGSKIEVLGTTVGNATFTTEKPWQATLRRVAPRLAKWLPNPVSGSCSSSSNSITVYLRLTGLTGTAAKPWNSYRSEDPDGVAYPSGAGYCTFGSAPGTLVYGLILRAYPRRLPEFPLRFLDRDGKSMFLLKVHNPVRGPFPVWEPAPLPQTHTNGPVALTLKGLRDHPPPYRRIEPTWHMVSTDPNWADGRPRKVTFFDATGNEGPFLSSREPAWKLRALVYREKPEAFAPDERFLLANVAVPRPGKYVALDQSATCDGVFLTALVLAGAGELFITNGVAGTMIPPGPGIRSSSHSTSSGNFGRIESYSSDKPFLVLQTPNLQPDDELQYTVTEETGRRVELQSTGGYNTGPAGRVYTPKLVVPPEATALNIEIRVSRPLAFEFFIDPADVKSNTATTRD